MTAKAILIAVGTMCLAAAGQAALVTVTFDGVSRNGIDGSDLFGLGNDLEGKNYVATFVFDDTIGYGGPSTIYGGSAAGKPSPLLSASLMVGGKMIGLTPGYADRLALDDGPTLSTGLYDLSESINFRVSFPATLTSAFYPYSGTGAGTIERGVVDTDGSIIYLGTYSVGTFVAGNTFVDFGDDTHVTISRLETPEPATWMLMLGGFGAIGGMLRRRRASPAAVRFA